MKPKRKHPQWDEILHSWYREQDRFIESLNSLGIDWVPTSFDDLRTALLRRTQACPLSDGQPLSDEDVELFAHWIEERVDAEVRRVVDLCLKRFLV